MKISFSNSSVLKADFESQLTKISTFQFMHQFDEIPNFALIIFEMMIFHVFFNFFFSLVPGGRS